MVISRAGKPRLADEQEAEDGGFSDDRLPGFVFYPGKFLSSTIAFDAEQEGWYIRLLAYAAENREYPGYLPADDRELRAIARNTGFSGNRIVEIWQNPELAKIVVEKDRQDAEDHERRWRKVVSKWVKAPVEGFIHNKRLTETLRKRDNRLEIRRRAGQIGSKKRWSEPVENREVSNNRIAEPLANGLQVDSTPNGKPMASGMHTQWQNGTKDKKKNIQEKITNVIQKKSPGETLFDEARFSITESMNSWLREKYPEFNSGDVDYLVEKFKHVYHGKRHVSWSRTFYNFINNQLTQYGYRPGSYDWRGRMNANGNGAGVPGYGKLTAPSLFETAEERNDRLSKEHRNYIEQLRREAAEDPEPLQAGGGGDAGRATESAPAPLSFSDED